MEKDWEEYKILQDKLDKIGEFRFKMKGWTITLFSGFVLGSFVSPLPKISFLFAFVIVALFHYFERYQSIWHKVYSNRIFDLENHLRKSTIGFPKIALCTRKEYARKKKQKVGRYLLRANDIFYIILYIVIVIIFVFNFINKNPSKIESIHFESPEINEIIR